MPNQHTGKLDVQCAKVAKFLEDDPLRLWSRGDLSACLDILPRQLSVVLGALHKQGRAFPHRPPDQPRTEWAWGTLAACAAAERRRVSTVRVAGLPPERPEWLSPVPVVEVRDGVRITRLAAPRGRFEADLPPGGGAITADWRESQKVAKRA